MHQIGPDIHADLLIYFKKGTSQADINKFSKDLLSEPRADNRGDSLPPGVQTFLRIYPPVNEHEGIAITFFSDATDSQRRELKAALDRSPMVYRILEHRVPADVKSLE